MKKIFIATLLSASFFSVNTYAEDTGNFYLGIGVSQIDVDLGSNIDVDEDTPVKFYAGYKVSPRLAVEAHHLKVDIDAKVANISATLDFKSTGIALVSGFPLSPKLSVLGKLGYAKNKAMASAIGTTLNRNDTGIFYGIGAQYNISSNLAIRGEFDKFNSKAKLFTVGANYTF